MKPKYEEKIAIIPKLDGSLVCVLSWREHKFQQVLPRGIQDWNKDEFKRHISNIVIPKLRLELLKVQKEALEMGDAQPEECVATLEVSREDADRIAGANLKRERKQLKLLN